MIAFVWIWDIYCNAKLENIYQHTTNNISEERRLNPSRDGIPKSYNWKAVF